MRQSFVLKQNLLILLCFLMYSTRAQVRPSGIYLGLSPHLQFVYNLDRSAVYHVKTPPTLSAFLNLGYVKSFANHFYADLRLGYGLRTFKYSYQHVRSNRQIAGIVETGIHLGYLAPINTKHSLSVHLGYVVDIADGPVTAIRENNELLTRNCGTQQVIMQLEMGMGVFYGGALWNFYTGISFKKGFVKANEVQILYKNAPPGLSSRIVSYGDNLSIHLKYFLRKRKKTES